MLAKIFVNSRKLRTARIDSGVPTAAVIVPINTSPPPTQAAKQVQQALAMQERNELQAHHSLALCT